MPCNHLGKKGKYFGLSTVPEWQMGVGEAASADLISTSLRQAGRLPHGAPDAGANSKVNEAVASGSCGPREDPGTKKKPGRQLRVVGAAKSGAGIGNMELLNRLMETYQYGFVASDCRADRKSHRRHSRENAIAASRTTARTSWFTPPKGHGKTVGLGKSLPLETTPARLRTFHL
jgi:hypothetical protein